MHTKRSLCRYGSFVLAPALLSAAAALAQTPAAPASAASAPDRAASAPPAQQITVYGTRQGKTQQKTADSVLVFTAEQLEKQGINNLRDALNRSPNAEEAQGGIAIRGVVSNQRDTSVTKPTIAIVRDGVSLDIVSFADVGAVWDIDQLEILRGSQSNAYGRTAIGGAIYLKTKDPTFVPEAEGRIGLGEFRSRIVSGVLSGPLIGDEWAGRIAFDVQHRDEDIASIYTGRPRSQYEELRGKLLYKPRFAPEAKALLTLQANRGSPYAGGGGIPSDDGNFYFRGKEPIRTDNEVGTEKPRALSGSLVVEFPFGANWKLESISSTLSRKGELNYRSLCYQPYVPGQPPVLREDTSDCQRSKGSWDSTTRAQELRLNYKHEALAATVGAYAERYTNTLGYNEFAFDGTPLVVDEGLDNLYNFKVNSRSFFGELGYDITPQWNLTAAARYSTETSRFDVSGPGAESTSSKVTPQVTLTYAPSSSLSWLATVKRGFKPGAAEVISGYADQAGTQLVQWISRYQPEVSDTAELALRWQSPQRLLRVSANVFTTRFKNRQEQVFVETDPDGNPVFDINEPSFPGAYITANAASAKSRGLELETALRPLDGLMLYANLGLNEGRYGKFISPDGDFSGQRFTDFPRTTANLGFVWDIPSGWSFGLNAVHRSKASTGGEGGAPVEPARTLYGGRVAYVADQWSVSLSGSNLADKVFRTISNRPEDSGPAFVAYGPRRRLLLEVRAQY